MSTLSNPNLLDKPFESRSLDYLSPELAEVVKEADRRWDILHPTGPNVFVTCTIRNHAQQDFLFAHGRSRPGIKVTWAKAGQSPHNRFPSLAWDVAFLETNSKKLNWNPQLFIAYAKIVNEVAKEKGVEITWGGDWNHDSYVDQKKTDLPHFQKRGWYK